MYPIDFQYLSKYKSLENEYLKGLLLQIDAPRKAEKDLRIDLSQDKKSISSNGKS